MKRICNLLLAALCMMILLPCKADALPREVEEILPEEARDILDDSGEEADGTPSLSGGLAALWNAGWKSVRSLLRESLEGAVLLLCAVLLCALADDCSKAADNQRVIHMVPAVGAIVVTMIASGDVHALIGVGMEAMDTLNTFSKALLPTLMAAIAAGGGATSAGVRHVAAAFFADILISLIRNVLLPLVYIYIAAAAADVLVPGRRLGTIVRAIGKGTTWILSGLLILYTGYLTLAGAAASSADALAVQLTRSAMGAVPVVGGIISDAAGTVLNGAAVLKNTVGIAGTLAVLAVCLMPFLRLAIQYLLYKATAFLAGTIGSKELVGLIDDLGGAFGLVLGMTGACAVLLLISTISSIMVVTA